MIEIHSRECAAMHLGLWAVEPNWFREALGAVNRGVWAASPREDSQPKREYALTDDGVAILPISGAMMKGESKYGGTSTINVRRQLRAAIADNKVQGVMLAIDSPGGTVAGTAELADDVRRADAAKPVHAYFEDTGASAAYWVGSQARRLTSNAAAVVGSIGVLSILYDTSKAYEEAGVEPVVITNNAPYKAMGYEGVEITPAMKRDWQGAVNTMGAQFKAGVAFGRGMDKDALEAVSDGRVWVGKQAQDVGLTDGVETFGEAMAALLDEIEIAGATPRRDSVEARARLG